MENEIKQRGITRLCHFTKISKILHILTSENGIVANTFLNQTNDDILETNDKNRFDGKEDYISCSIEYPNSWYLNKIKVDPLFNEWVIMYLDPLIIENKETLFCFTNAAYANGRFLKPGLDSFQNMFSDVVTGKRRITRSPRMLECCPTDGQAEVMIYKNISKSSIMGLTFNSFEQARRTKVMLDMLNVQLTFNLYVAPDLFENNWNQIIRRGTRPKEILYVEG